MNRKKVQPGASWLLGLALAAGLSSCLQSSQTDTPHYGDELFVVGGWSTTADEWIGYLFLTDDLSADAEIDLSHAVEFPDDMNFESPGDGNLYVGRGGAPIVEKWIVNDEDKLEKVDEVDFTDFGLRNALASGRNAMHFISEERAYFVDGASMKVVVWNPKTMEHTGSFGFDGIYKDEYWQSANFIHRDGDRLIITTRYWREDDTADELVRAAFIDVHSDAVTYAEDTRCGNISSQAVDEDGNLYLSSHTGQAVALAAGLAGEPAAKSCILRINKGESEFDPDYFVDLSELSDGFAGGMMQGADGQAFVLKWEGGELDEENYGTATRAEEWEVYSLTLGDEEATFAKVPNIGKVAGYGEGFTVNIRGEEIPILVAVKGDFSEGSYWDISNPGNPEKALTISGWPGKAVKIR